ncbi:serine hydrolase domain-containing protein [Tumebacillus flagellatus]|uniref:Beta-lactamase-related domain-containing protein n=1 Tax=Tumebacillus flagellatus TaxID=1157490 RepID=A0A074LM15_9BACL|nr:serine hydrolase domain-containing protein [Tumebacillus flagellatus]KEO80948.1 hypothetical protein EL26_23525 [Tumebacillus flagellatus]
MEEKLQALMAKYGAVGLSAAVVRAGEVSWSGGFGVSDLQRGLPVTPETMFRVASISKVMVGTALMQQWEQGKFQLDDDIGELLGFSVRNPNHPERAISVRHLLTHNGSLHEEQTPAAEEAYYGFLGASRTTDEPPQMRELLVPGGRYYTADIWAPWAAGEKFEYSNLGTGILATILERLSGERFDVYVRENICKPLGMRASFNVQDLEEINRLSVIYNAEHEPRIDHYQGVKPIPQDLRSYEVGTNGMIFSPQGGLRASVLDLVKLLLAHQQGLGGLLRPETLQLMHREQWRGCGVNGLYKQKGLHVHITDDLLQGMRLYGHAGDAYGVLTGMYFSKEENFGLCYCINGAEIKQGEAFYEVEEALARVLAV